MALGNDIALLLKIKGDSSDAVAALNRTTKETKQLDTATKGLGGTMSGLVNPTALAAAGITALAAAGIAAGKALLDLTISSAQFGSEIFDASEKTGLATETLSAMKFAADQSGTSLDAVTTATSRFTKTIAEAGFGSEEAQAKLARLGVTSKDLDEALQQALATIVKLPPGVAQMTAAQDAFGRSGADLLPFIKSFDGDLDKLVATAQRLGVVLSKEDARAADEFGDTLDALKSQAQALGFQFTSGLMKDITSSMKDISEALGRNKDAVKDWGEQVRQTLSGLKNISVDLYNFSQTTAGRVLKLLLFGGISAINEGIQQLADPKLPKPGSREQIEGRKPATPDATTDYLDAVEKERKAREEARKRDLEAQKDHVKKLLQLERDKFEATQKEIEDDFKGQHITQERFLEASEESLTNYSARAKKLLLDSFRLDAAGKTAAEIANLRLAKESANIAIDKEIERERDARNALIKQTTEKAEDQRLEVIQQKLQREVELRNAAGKVILSGLENQLTRRDITEKEFIQRRQSVETELANFKLKKLQEELAAFSGNAEEKLRIEHEIALQVQEISDLENKHKKENADFVIDTVKELNEAYKEQLKLRQQILEVERQIQDEQAAETRKTLEGNVETADTRPGRNAALIALRDFEIEEARRKKQQDSEDLQREKEAAIERLTEVEKELGMREELEELYREKAILAEEEFNARLLEIRRATAEEFEADGGLFGAIEAGIEQLGANITLIDLATQAFEGLARGIASAIQQYVLYGKSAPEALRQVLAATLAQIAAEAAIQAIRAAAYGFLFLATGNYAAAGNAFASAALWAGIAVGAALLGRAIAPKKETAASSSFSQSASGAGGTGRDRDTSGQGTQFSGQKDAVINRDINAPGGRGVQVNNTLTVKVEGESFLAKALRFELATNGEIRGMLKEVAQQS